MVFGQVFDNSELVFVLSWSHLPKQINKYIVAHTIIPITYPPLPHSHSFLF
jgi:hypothetical protein